MGSAPGQPDGGPPSPWSAKNLWRLQNCWVLSQKIHRQKSFLNKKVTTTPARLLGGLDLCSWCVYTAAGSAALSWGGVPYPVPTRGTPSTPNKWGTPIQSQPGRYPIQSQWGVTPSSPEGGTGVPPIGQMGVPPPCLPEMWTDRHLWKQYLPHSFGMRMVKISE